MKHYIFGNREEMLQVLRSEKQTQGLMQIYQDFCTQNQNNCLHCQFPNVEKNIFPEKTAKRHQSYCAIPQFPLKSTSPLIVLNFRDKVNIPIHNKELRF